MNQSSTQDGWNENAAPLGKRARIDHGARPPSVMMQAAPVSR